MAESKVKRDNYITIQGFMLTELKLKGNELIIYACIYGFSQAENQTFSGSLQYLADWTNSTKQGVMKNLKALEEKGYIGKKVYYINGVKFCSYYATKFNTPLNNVDEGIQQSLTGGMQQSLPNNIDLDIDSNNINNSDREEPKRKRFVPPTLEEIKAYCVERKNGVDAQRFFDYYTSNGWLVGKNKMKDWKAAVRTWERNGFSSKKSVGANGIAINHNKSDITDLF